MEDWQKDFLAIVETVKVEFDRFCEDVAEEVGEAIEVFAERLENTVSLNFDLFSQFLFDESIIETHNETNERETNFENIVDAEETEFFSTYRIDPLLANQPACVGCRHYHGKIYGGNLIVCGMHAYGWDDENCPDREQVISNK
jgi:hypothetical protein